MADELLAAGLTPAQRRGISRRRRRQHVHGHARGDEGVALGDQASRAETTPTRKVVVVGCYAVSNPEEIEAIDGVDVILGNNDKERFAEALWSRQPTAPLLQLGLARTDRSSFTDPPVPQPACARTSRSKPAATSGARSASSRRRAATCVRSMTTRLVVGSGAPRSRAGATRARLDRRAPRQVLVRLGRRRASARVV